MPQLSAGLVLFRWREGALEVLLIHPGGPYWSKKDDGAWSIPKGLYKAGEDARLAAEREFEEETGHRPEGERIALGEIKLPSGKRLAVWAVEGDFDLALFKSNAFRLEWPPRSGHVQEFPEADRAAWFPAADAKRKITKGQVPILERLFARLGLPTARTVM
jgi:predicted NUDIX family NTP pyrophosphohydrolase